MESYFFLPWIKELKTPGKRPFEKSAPQIYRKFSKISDESVEFLDNNF